MEERKRLKEEKKRKREEEEKANPSKKQTSKGAEGMASLEGKKKKIKKGSNIMSVEDKMNALIAKQMGGNI